MKQKEKTDPLIHSCEYCYNKVYSPSHIHSLNHVIVRWSYDSKILQYQKPAE